MSPKYRAGETRSRDTGTDLITGCTRCPVFHSSENQPGSERSMWLDALIQMSMYDRARSEGTSIERLRAQSCSRRNLNCNDWNMCATLDF